MAGGAARVLTPGGGSEVSAASGGAAAQRMLSGLQTDLGSQFSRMCV